MLLIMSVPTSPCLLECWACGNQALVSMLELGSHCWLLPLLPLLLKAQPGEALVKATGGGTGDLRFLWRRRKGKLEMMQRRKRGWRILWVNMKRL